MLQVSGLTVRYGSKTILGGVDFRLEENQWLMVVGPNGAGKSTLIGAVSQSIPYTGLVQYQGSDAAKLKPQALAQKIGVLMQNHMVGYDFTVEDVVRMGRYAWSKGFMQGPSHEDSDKVDEALGLTGMSPMRTHSVRTLSGGELQRTFLAQVLAQDPQLLLLDEPANHLDLIYQQQVFSLVSEWVRGKGRAVLSVVHDLSLAKAYGTHALLLNRGKIAAHGEIGAVLTPANLRQVYEMDVAAWMTGLLSQWEGL